MLGIVVARGRLGWLRLVGVAIRTRDGTHQTQKEKRAEELHSWLPTIASAQLRYPSFSLADSPNSQLIDRFSAGIRRIGMRHTLRYAVLLSLAVAQSAHAAMLRHTDLAGLVWRSEAIVIAERDETKDARTAQQATRYRVTRSFRGPLHAGDELSLDDGNYALDSGVSVKPLDTTVVLFLVRTPDAERSSAPQPWMIVPSGLRIVSQGRVYRFEQLRNPGLFVPVPQGHDPEDARGELSDPQAVELIAFEAMLHAAIAQVAAFRATLLLPTPDARAQVRQLLGPPRDFFVPLHSYSYDNVLADESMSAFTAAGDVDGVLEVVARSHAWQWLHIDAPLLFERAVDSQRPVEVRCAALESLAMATPKDASMERAIAKLARTDATPEVRAAAITMLSDLTGVSDYGGRAAQKRRRVLFRSVASEVLAHEADPRVLAVARKANAMR
jgi:hypothetical protein